MASKLRQALHHIEESPWTRNWNHLTPVYNSVWRRPGQNTKTPPPVSVQDRIRQWNIVPGDRIRIRGDRDGTIKEVFGINKFRNLVFLKTPQDETTDGERPQPLSVSYARCQLYIGDREFPPGPGETAPQVIPVFASRIGCTTPKFDVSQGRFDWERFALQTTPRLWDRGEKVKIAIPWPKPDPPVIPPIQADDTPEDVVKEITWKPSPIHYPPSTYVKAKSLQDAYLHSIRPLPDTVPVVEYDPTTSAPIEYSLSDELSNPHSRAKKQHRARRRRVQLELAHKRFLEGELANLDGRTRREAVIEAEWKWKEHLRKEDRERKKTQWIMRGGAARLNRKRQRRARKARRVSEKLKNLTLKSAPNQVIPQGLSAS